jgi:Tol biopolymer transport system component
VHVRGSVGGTYFSDGNKVIRRNLKTPEMKYGAVYPAWHPGGKLIAFSSNSIVQSFHAAQEYNIEVTDLASSLVVYDLENNEMSQVTDDDSIKYMETFPEWSPDGRYLYYCRAKQTNDTSDNPRIKYDLVRKQFDQTDFSFGKAEILFNADSINKSVSFPKISPDGQYLVFTLHNNGNFSIWHKEADLYLLDIPSGKVSHLDINSTETESYHSWSSNSKWLVFSSKRGDGLTARPYFSYFGKDGNFAKPFVLPQKDPTLYRNLVKTFNRPEFVSGEIKAGPRDFERASRKEAEISRTKGNQQTEGDTSQPVIYLH